MPHGSESMTKGSAPGLHPSLIRTIFSLKGPAGVALFNGVYYATGEWGVAAARDSFAGSSGEANRTLDTDGPVLLPALAGRPR